MSRKIPARSLALALLGVALSSLVACTGSTEDVRVSFCKGLAKTQLNVADDVAWAAVRQHIQRPEYARITVQVQGGGRTSCWFEYDAIEETAETQVDPLSAYSTLPYQVSVNGRVLGKREALDAVNAEQRRLGRQAVDQIGRAMAR